MTSTTSNMICLFLTDSNDGSVFCSIFNPLESILRIWLYGCHLILHFCCAVSCVLSSCFCLIFFSLKTSQTSHHLSSSSNLPLHSCLFPLLSRSLPFASVLCSSFINGFDVTPHFSSNCFSSVLIFH